MNLHDFSTKLNNKELADSNGDPNWYKHAIAHHTFEDIKLIIYFSGWKHVEDLEQHE